MGILGSLLYPDNSKLAQELNTAEDTLRKTNNLHNDLVNSYRLMGEKIKSFDAYLMAIMSMQYFLTYTEEDLSNLPDTKVPTLSSYWADTVESLAMDTLTAKMAIDGFKAIKNGIGNLVKESGIFSKSGGATAEAATEMGAEVESVGLTEPLLAQGEVAALTTESTAKAAGLGTELGAEAKAVSSAIEEEGAASKSLTEISETAGSAEEGAALAEEGASLGGKLMAGASAALGPALLVVTVVTEILSAIHAGQEHAKLEKAKEQLSGVQGNLDKSVTDLKKTFTKLLKAGKADIDTYNKLLPKLKALEHSSMFDRASFSTNGIDTYISGMDSITITNTAVAGYQAAAVQNLDDATSFIRDQAVHDSKMTSIIKQIKTHMRDKGLTNIGDDDEFLQSVAIADSIDLAQVQAYNKFRVFLTKYASVLLPYHQEIQKNSTKGKVPSTPSSIPEGKPSPTFDPKPSDFQIPGVS